MKFRTSRIVEISFHLRVQAFIASCIPAVVVVASAAFPGKHKRAEYDAIQRQTRRDFVKVTAGVAGAGVLAGLLGGIGIGRSEAQSGGKKDPEVISSGPGGQVGSASVIVFQDSSGNNYAIDRGAGLSSANGLVGELLVKANVTTTYYNTLTGNAADATTTTAGIQEAINA